MIPMNLPNSLAICITLYSGVLGCIDDVDIWKTGSFQQPYEEPNRTEIVIVKGYNFSCYGTIMGIAVSMNLSDEHHYFNYPSIQIWGQDSVGYYIRKRIYLSESHVTRYENDGNTYWIGNISFINGISIYTGNIVGYTQLHHSRYRINVERGHYTLIRRDISYNQTYYGWSPLIQFTVGNIHCGILKHPSNGHITSCSSGTTDYGYGIGNEGNTCTFTCHTGYLLTSSTAVCRSGNWNVTDLNKVCKLEIPCDNLITPSNGSILSCSSGTIGVGYASRQDSCIFSCDSGYFLAGSSSAICLSNGSWNATNPDTICTKGCSAPHNGRINCRSGLVNGGIIGDTCSFLCNTGYILLHNITSGRCQRNAEWSEGNPICRNAVCPNHVTIILTNTYTDYRREYNKVLDGCSLEYQSKCNVSCIFSYTGNAVTYKCTDIDSLGTVGWQPINHSPLVCEKVHCDYTLANGRSSCNHPEYNKCSFSCNDGYSLVGTTSARVCMDDGEWSGGNPACIINKCSSLPPYNETQQFEPSCTLNYNSDCTTVCRYGYNGIGGYYTCVSCHDCHRDLMAWIGSTTCTPVQCPELISPANGLLQCSHDNSTSFYYKDVCAQICNIGYELAGTSYRTCQGNGSWSGSLASCIIKKCPLLSLPTNSIISESCNSTYQSICNLQCPEVGFTSTGNPRYVCEALNDQISVAWMPSGEPYSCNRVSCPTTSISLPEHSHINITGILWYQDQVSFSCDRGYQLTGSLFTQCLADGSWSTFNITCEIIHCDSLETAVDLSHTEPSNNCLTGFGSQCTLFCVTGYRHSGGNTFVCDIVNNRTRWRNNGQSFHCERASCIAIGTLPNGHINCSNNNQQHKFGDYCTFQCDDGYELVGSMVRRCEASGWWNGSISHCNIRHCISFTEIVPNSRPCDTSYSSICTVECEDGYNRLGDSIQYSCSLNGTDVLWIGNRSGVTCSPVQCSMQELAGVENGGIHCPSNTTDFQDVCHHYCNSGYRLTGNPEVRCGASGKWISRNVTCNPVRCDTLFNPDNGNVTCPSNPGVFQDICTYHCDHGYQLVGNNKTQCIADGTWNSEPVTCSSLRCFHTDVEIANSQPVGTCNRTYGSYCLLNCTSGFSSHGNKEYVCDDLNEVGTSVKWRSVDGSLICTESAASESGASDNAIGGIVAGIVIFTLIISVAVLLLVIWLRRRQLKKSSYLIASTSEDDDGVLLPQR